jgi:biopolymer transport protein ExbD
MKNNYFEQRGVSSNMRFTLMITGTLSLLMLFVGCNKTTIPTDKGMESINVDVPREMKNAEEDAAIAREGHRIVSLLSPYELYIGQNTYSVVKDRVSYSGRLEEQVRANAEQMVYFQGAASAEYELVASVLSQIRIAGADNIGLIVSGKSANQGSTSLRRFAVKLPPEPEPNEKIKPDNLLLVAELSAAGKIRLNQNEMGEISQPGVLTSMLTRIFEQRTNSNVAEKAVKIKAAKQASYADVVRVIDAVKGAGGSPIILEIYDLNEK